MPIPFIISVVSNGLPFDTDPWLIGKAVLVLAVLVVLRRFNMGAKNTCVRQMHSKVVMITGGTTGIGAQVALSLATAGAQVILLTRQEPSDIFLVDYINDLRSRTNNEMIYAEQVDLSSTHSIRKFATKWIDNAPPRRLDMIILAAATITPSGKEMVVTQEGIEENWMVNYTANFHLLSILSPALRNQPPDRDVRVIVATCGAYATSTPLYFGQTGLPTPASKLAQESKSKKESKNSKSKNEPTIEKLNKFVWSPSDAFARSKFAMHVFAIAFQKHLNAYKRSDGSPMNTRVIIVDPGLTRTPGMRRWLTRGSLWGLGLYLVLWHQVWFWLKGPEQGAQSLLWAAMEESLGRGDGGHMVKECQIVEKFPRQAEIESEDVAKALWEGSEVLIERVEREEAVKRALAKKLSEEEEKDLAAKVMAEGLKKEAKVGKDEKDEAKDAEGKRSRRARKKAA